MDHFKARGSKEYIVNGFIIIRNKWHPQSGRIKSFEVIFPSINLVQEWLDYKTVIVFFFSKRCV